MPSDLLRPTSSIPGGTDAVPSGVTARGSSFGVQQQAEPNAEGVREAQAWRKDGRASRHSVRRTALARWCLHQSGGGWVWVRYEESGPRTDSSGGHGQVRIRV